MMERGLMSNENLECGEHFYSLSFFFFFLICLPWVLVTAHGIFIASYTSFTVVHGLSLVVVCGLSSSTACGILVP